MPQSRTFEVDEIDEERRMDYDDSPLDPCTDEELEEEQYHGEDVR